MRGLLSRSWPILALSAVLVGALLLLAAVTPNVDTTDDRSCLRANRWGTKALADLCRQSRPPLRPVAWRRPLTEVEEVDDLLLILQPVVPLIPAEEKAIVAWVEAGGRLVLGGSGLPAFGSSMGSPAGLGSLCRKLDARLEMGGVTPKALAPEPGSPLARDVSVVSLTGSGRVHVDDPEKHQALVHLRAPDGPVVVSLHRGAGQVYILADTTFLANGLLNKADNVVFAADLLYALSRGRVYFDEYHHGFGSGSAGTIPPGQRRALGWAVLATIAATLIYFSGKFRRFGAPVPAFDPQRRSVLEYVTAMGDLYRRAGAYPAALQLLRQAFLSRLALAAGLSPRAGPPAIAAAVARRHGAEGQPVLRLAQRAADCVASGRVSPGEFVRLSAEMAAMEQRLRRRPHPSASSER